ncbi:hypothetical protein ACFWGC_26570 [Cytobacillus pseudoceanisediminis]|uniref:hypothetical protein n=1 Tax=Cytobacillus pseudoceanisediminis TaxID=3051614 RepID=UPI003664C637
MKNKEYLTAVFFLLLAAFSSVTYFLVDHEYQALISTLAMAGGILTIIYLILAFIRKRKKVIKAVQTET